jgi:hypothetical protein
MRDAIFILFVILVLFGLTAIRYRKQIAGMIGVARMLRDAKANVGQRSQRVQDQAEKSIPLVNCSKCGVWVPQNKARKIGDIFYCSDVCLTG